MEKVTNRITWMGLWIRHLGNNKAFTPMPCWESSLQKGKQIIILKKRVSKLFAGICLYVPSSV